jgi:hypothetical protein
MYSVNPLPAIDFRFEDSLFFALWKSQRAFNEGLRSSSLAVKLWFTRTGLSNSHQLHRLERTSATTLTAVDRMGKTKEAGLAASASADKVASEARQDALLDHEARGSPVLTLIAKRLRAAKKKVKKVEEIETIKNSGRDINSDQVCLILPKQNA